MKTFKDLEEFITAYTKYTQKTVDVIAKCALDLDLILGIPLQTTQQVLLDMIEKHFKDQQ